MGKTAVFVLAILQRLEPQKAPGKPQVIVICHARELAFQICKEFERFSKHLDGIVVRAFYGGVPVQNDLEVLRRVKPNIIVGTPGRLRDLVDRETQGSRNRGEVDFLDVSNVSFFVIDECDRVLQSSTSTTSSRSMTFFSDWLMCFESVIVLHFIKLSGMKNNYYYSSLIIFLFLSEK
jgi:ATP-dependent RNA helicase UAP56/SUB2